MSGCKLSFAPIFYLYAKMFETNKLSKLLLNSTYSEMYYTMFRNHFSCESDFYMHTLGLLFANLQGYTLSKGTHKFINFDGQLRISIYVDNNNKVSYDFRMLVLDLTVIKDMGSLNWYLSHGELFEQIYNEIKQKISNVRRKRKFSTRRGKDGTKHGKSGIWVYKELRHIHNQ